LPSRATLRGRRETVVCAIRYILDASHRPAPGRAGRARAPSPGLPRATRRGPWSMTHLQCNGWHRRQSHGLPRTVARLGNLPPPPLVSLSEARKTFGTQHVNICAKSAGVDNRRMLAELGSRWHLRSRSGIRRVCDRPGVALRWLRLASSHSPMGSHFSTLNRQILRELEHAHRARTHEHNSGPRANTLGTGL